MIGVIIAVGIQLLGWFLDKSSAEKETKKRFFEWVKMAGNDLSSVRLMEYGDKQLKWFETTPFEETK